MTRTEHSKGTRADLKAVSFDLTYTLLHAPRRDEIYQEILERHGIEAEVNQLARSIPEVWTELSCQADARWDRFATHPGGARAWWFRFLCRLSQHLDQPTPSRFAAAELFDRFSHAEAWEIYPDVVPTLQALRNAGLRLAVVSNWDERLPILLDRLRLTDYFDPIVYSAALGVEKPNPEIFLHCAHLLGVPPSQILHVGDRALEDVEGALAAGMRALRVDRQARDFDLHSLLLQGLGHGPLGKGLSQVDGLEKGRHAGF